jgi:phosphoribosylanthranilate isomerase
MFVKICGLRTPGDVEVAVSAGADAVGFVFATSPRQVDPATARTLASAAGDVLTVGVFLGQPAAEVRAIAEATGIGAVQLHGDYPESVFRTLADPRWQLIRAVPHGAPDLRPGAYGDTMTLVDAPRAGSGEVWDYESVAGLSGQWLLAGGLTPTTVAAACAVARPWGVDVSSGIEATRGVKDHGLIKDFIAAARS